MAEVRTNREGSLWWVRASGSGTTWATASAAVSGLFGYVDSFTYTSAANVVQVMDRGTPSHNKLTSKSPINGSVSFRWTGAHPTAVSGSGASVPMVHIEYKAAIPESNDTGYYVQIHGIPLNNIQFAEGEQDSVTMSFIGLAMNGPTASGYCG